MVISGNAQREMEKSIGAGGQMDKLSYFISPGIGEPISSETLVFNTVLEEVSTYFGISKERIQSGKPLRDCTLARGLVAFFIKRQLGRKGTLKNISIFLGMNSHCATLYGLRLVEGLIEVDKPFCKDVETIKENLDLKYAAICLPKRI